MAVINRYKYHMLVAVAFFVIRLPSLGSDNFNTDVWKWKARSYDFGTGVFNMQFDKTLQKYHPGVTLMWIGTVGVKLQNLILDKNTSLSAIDAIFLLDKIQKVLTVAVISITTAFIFHVVYSLFGLRLGLLSAYLIGVEPFFVGLTRVFHLEGLLSVFMLASVLWLYFYVKETSKVRRLYLSGFFAGLALLTKTSALFLLPFTFLVLAYCGYIKVLGKPFIKPLLIWFLMVMGTCFLLWPALWTNLIGVLQALYKGIVVVGLDTDHYQFYFGKYVDSPGYLYYFVVFFLRFSPILVLGLLGLAVVFCKLSKEKKEFVLFVIAYSAVYFLEITLPTKKLDRYILPSAVALCSLAALFWDYLYDRVGKQFKCLISALLVIVPITTLVILHPDYLSYYSPMVGGLRTGIKVIEPKWMIGTPEIISYFDALSKTKGYVFSDQNESFEEIVNSTKYQNVLTVGFQEKYYTQIWPFFREIGGWAVVQELAPFAIKTKYFVYPVWGDSGVNETRFPVKKIDVIKVRGVVVYNVYERV